MKDATFGIFNNTIDMEEAMNDLETSGFERANISLLKSKVRGGQTIAEKKQYIEDNIDRLERMQPVKTEEIVLAKGVFAFTSIYVVVAIAIFAFGLEYVYSQPFMFLLYSGLAAIAVFLTAAYFAEKIGKGFFRFERKEIKNGGLTLFVKTPDRKSREKARLCMKRHNVLATG